MGGDDELHVGIVVHEPDEQLLVGAPRRAGHEEALVAAEALDNLDAFGRRGDFGHPVETGVARNHHVVEAQFGQQALRLLVLDEHRVEALQRLAPDAAVGAEENRVAAEDGRDDVGAYRAVAQLGEQVNPEFVLDEDGYLGVGDVEEAAGVRRRVNREVEDVVHAAVVLADFVARRGEEGEQDFVLGVLLAEPFDDGTPLFEFAQRGDVYPDDARLGVDGVGHPFEEIFPPLNPKLRLGVSRRDQPDGQCIEHESEIIEPHRYLRLRCCVCVPWLPCGAPFVRRPRQSGPGGAVSVRKQPFQSGKGSIFWRKCKIAGRLSA